MEEARTAQWVGLIDGLCAGMGGRLSVEIFFDGPRRSVGVSCSNISVRFPMSGTADDMILGAVRLLAREGRAGVVVTQDDDLASDCVREGARVIRFSEFESRLRSGRC
ncbi:MAG: hypothetical protein WCU88_04875 [Elusimicrobiota bacterium]|jgi:hypothetical protein